MKTWLRSALVLTVLIASQLHARVDIIGASARSSRIEYHPDGMRSGEVGATHASGSATYWRRMDRERRGIRLRWARYYHRPVGRLGFHCGRGMARRQRVVELAFAPLIDGEEGASAERVIVELGYEDVAPRGRWKDHRFQDAHAESFYRQIVSNYEQASEWRVPRLRRPLAKPAQFAGRWLRITVGESGMFRVTGEDLQEAGVALDDVDPQTLRLLYGGGEALPEKGIQPPSAWKEMGLVVEDGGDGRFDPADYVLFYGEAAQRWEYDGEEADYVWRGNLYTDDNAYWLGFAGGIQGKRQAQRSGALSRTATQEPEHYRVYIHSEEEQFILYQTYGIKSGYTWYGEDFRGNARNFRVLVNDPVDSPVDIRLGFIGIGGNTSRFNVRWNGARVGNISFDSPRPVRRALESEDGPIDGLNELGLFHSGDPARFDWYELEHDRRFTAERNRLSFLSPVVNEAARDELTGFTEEMPRIFEVSDTLVEIEEFLYETDGGRVVFQDDPRGAGSLRDWRRLFMAEAQANCRGSLKLVGIGE